MPQTSQSRSIAARVAARMTAFRPGASPPPVLMAIFLFLATARRLLKSQAGVRYPPATMTQPHTVLSPFSGEAVGEVQLAGEGEIESALERARALHREARQGLKRALRGRVLRYAARRVRERHGELARLIAREGGKPLTDARFEIDRASAGL